MSSEIYNLTYEVQFEGSDKRIVTDQDSFDGISLETVFGRNRLTEISNNSFYFTVTIDSRCTAEIYWNDEKISNSLVNDGWSLGTSISYDAKGDIDSNRGPDNYNLTYTTYKNDACEDYHILVVLSIVDRQPTIDLRSALMSDNLSKRGSTGIDEGPDYMSGNLRTLDGWNWNVGGTLKDQVQPLEKQDDGSYAWTWTFQTNTGNYWLDSFVVNDTACTVPFVPTLNYNTGETQPPEKTTKTTVLPNGTHVTIECVRSFSNGGQRVYKVTFSNVYVDLILTGANLMDYGNGSAEVVVYSLQGIRDNSVYFGDSQSSLGKIATISFIDTLRFYLRDYYGDPVLKITYMDGTELVTFTDFVVTDDGMYEVSNIDLPEAQKIRLLYISATPVKYAIRYNSGAVADAILPGLETWYDNNKGNYYTVENSNVIVINDYAPIDLTSSKTFKCWTVQDERTSVMIAPKATFSIARRISYAPIAAGETMSPGQIFDFTHLLKYAKEVNGIYEITLTASWEDN